MTVDELAFASTIMSLPPDDFTFSSSPSTVLSFFPSVRSEASRRPATT
jgi:hypothetical protein